MSYRKKIVLVSPAHPLRGGIAASSERLAQALQDAGHEVVLYSFSLQYPDFLFPGKTQYTDDPPPPNLRIRTRLNTINPFNWLAVGREIAREAPDQVIVRFWLPLMGPCLGTVLRVARRFSPRPFRITALVDNIIPHEKRPGDRPFARYFVRSCDDFVVMSKAVGEEIGQFLAPAALGDAPPAPPGGGEDAPPPVLQRKDAGLEVPPPALQRNDTGLEAPPPALQRNDTGLEVPPPTLQRKDAGLEVPPPALQRKDAGLEAPPPALQRKDAGLEVPPPALQRKDAGLEVPPPALQRKDAGLEVPPPALQRKDAGLEVPPPTLQRKDTGPEAAPLPSGGAGGGTSGGSIRYAPHPIYDIYGAPLEKTDARQQLGLPDHLPVVLFFGLIRKYKGLDLLLQALARVAGVHVLVAGECYDDWAFYQSIIDENSLAGRVHLHLDFIPAEQVRLFFAAADLVVQPYRTATQSGISQIAYHFDKPMVVTRVGGLPEIVTDGVSGYVTEPEPEALAAAIRDFFEHNRAESMQAGVRAEKKRFSWENLVKQLLEGK